MSKEALVHEQARRERLLEPSPYAADRGELIGRDPRRLPVAELQTLDHPDTPMKAIRAKCVDCCGGNVAEVRKCTAIDCPLWRLRMGSNPLYGKRSQAQTP